MKGLAETISKLSLPRGDDIQIISVEDIGQIVELTGEPDQEPGAELVQLPHDEQKTDDNKRTDVNFDIEEFLNLK